MQHLGVIRTDPFGTDRFQGHAASGASTRLCPSHYQVHGTPEVFREGSGKFLRVFPEFSLTMLAAKKVFLSLISHYKWAVRLHAFTEDQVQEEGRSQVFSRAHIELV